MAGIDERDLPLATLMEMASGERRRLLRLFWDKECRTVGDAAGYVRWGTLRIDTLQNIIDLNDDGQVMPNLIVKAAHERLEWLYKR